MITFDVLSTPSGVSAHWIKKKYGLAYTTAHLLLHRIREHMGRCLSTAFVNTVVEVDESYISTGNKGFHRHYPFKRGRGSEKNSTIMSIVERDGKCLFIKIPDVQATTLLGIIEKHVDRSCKIFTDNLPAYRGLGKRGYFHQVVNHKSPDGTKRWVDGMASTNSAENAFSNIKRSLKGIYRSVSDEHLQNYLNEFSFKHSYRNTFDCGFETCLNAMPPLSETYRYKKTA
ncbi:MAG: IS1595 family transposase [Bacteroidetes bacterium]|nr:IS1595 family transposase [Bacteroidota bacterium]